MPYKSKKDKQKANKKNYVEKRKGTRFRCWSLIFYPDSVPADWKDQLSDLHLRIWVSPLHDRDKWTSSDEEKNLAHKAGMLKKPHYHLVVEYPNPVDAVSVVGDFSCLRGAKKVERVRDKVPMVRYLLHKDDPQKAQYKVEDMVLFGGAESDIVEQLGTSERHAALREMRKYIVRNGVVDFYAFCLYCDDCMEAWSRLLDDNSCYVIERFIKSYRAAVRESPQLKCDKKTGEVIE